ncbi:MULTISPECIES: hypothetical protein [Paraburkholderia]|uniref:hypothetical protein n=1 Tax=Paraburkholderia TaxID=1822464 RepID=UPI001CC4AEB6|nr:MULTISPECIES: hypothetical protein [Paraburkholderia]
MASADYEISHAMSVNVDGVDYTGRWRVMTGSVIVYFANEIKFAPHGANRPEQIARWLLTDLCKKIESRKRKGIKR